MAAVSAIWTWHVLLCPRPLYRCANFYLAPQSTCVSSWDPCQHFHRFSEGFPGRNIAEGVVVIAGRRKNDIRIRWRIPRSTSTHCANGTHLRTSRLLEREKGSRSTQSVGPTPRASQAMGGIKEKASRRPQSLMSNIDQNDNVSEWVEREESGGREGARL